MIGLTSIDDAWDEPRYGVRLDDGAYLEAALKNELEFEGEPQ